MRRFAIATTTFALVATAFIATSHAAAAASPAPAQEYKDAMAPFVQDIAHWADVVQQATDAAVIKPELGCTDEMTEYVRIAGWMKDDLDGTARLAPSDIRAAHDALSATVAQMGSSVALACSDPSAAAAQLATERTPLNIYLHRIDSFTHFRDGDA